MAWAEVPTELFEDAELNFDPQAFFDDYMFTGKICVEPEFCRCADTRTDHQLVIASCKELANQESLRFLNGDVVAEP